MTDPTPLSAEEEARLRRLLVEARSDAPIPPEVAAQLEATLAELVREREPSAADVIALDRRRPRAIAGVLAAAAIVVVAGVGLTQVLGDGANDTTASGVAEEAGEVPDRAGSGDEDAAAETLLQSDGAPGAEAELFDLRDGLVVRTSGDEAPRVDRRGLAAGARQVRAGLPADAADHWSADGEALLLLPVDFDCSAAAWGAGVLVGIHYGRDPAILAFRSPSRQNQIVEVLQCGTAEVLGSVTLDAP